MTSNELMKANIKALLRLREREPEDLARWCRKSASWIDKIFREPQRSFRIEHYEKIAKFFGVEIYQLLQPGIAEHSERRQNGDRRKILDRRVSQAVLSEKALDTDLIHIVRALSHSGRQKAIGVLMDVLNDELARLRARPAAPDESRHSADSERAMFAPRPTAPRKRKAAPPPK